MIALTIIGIYYALGIAAACQLLLFETDIRLWHIPFILIMACVGPIAWLICNGYESKWANPTLLRRK